MAARKLKPFHQEQAKSHIQVGLLIRFLSDYSLKGSWLGREDINPKRIDAAIKLLEFRLSKPTPDIIQAIQVNMYPPALQQSAANLLKSISSDSVSRETLAEIELRTNSESIPGTITEVSCTIAEDDDIDRDGGV